MVAARSSVLSLKLLQPVQRGDRKAGRGCGAASLREQGAPDVPFDFGQKTGAALVGPDNRRAQQALGLVEQHQAVHLAREADAQGLVQRFVNRHNRRAPPLLGLLLGVPEARREDRVLCNPDALQGTFHPKRRHLQARGAQVDTK
jgi:hypothetical protein